MAKKKGQSSYDMYGNVSNNPGWNSVPQDFVPMPPQPDCGGTRRKKRSKAPLIIIIVLCVVIIALTAALILIIRSTSRPALSTDESAAVTEEPAAVTEEPAAVTEEPVASTPEPAVQDTAAAVTPVAVTDADVTFSITDINGYVITEQVFGEAGDATITMLNLWEPWCGPCVSEMPDLELLYEDYYDSGFRIIGCYTTPGYEDAVDSVLAEAGTNYTIAFVGDEFSQFDTGYVPTVVFLDSQGHVIWGPEAGSRSYSEWESILIGLMQNGNS